MSLGQVGAFRHLLTLAGALGALIATPALAQQRPEPPFRYTVQPGDTLSQLSRDYFVKDDYRTVQEMNNVANPRRLPIGSILLIPVPLLRTEPVPAKVTSFRGTVTVDGRPAAVGTEVRQGMRVETGANANVTVTLEDGSAISLPSQSRILIARLRRILLTGSVDRNFVLEAGRSRATVTPFRDPESNFRVTTPLSVSAVRGTDFRVALGESGGDAITEVVGGTVGVAPDEEKDETGVRKGFGTIATSEGVQPPVPLLPPPPLAALARTPAGISVSAAPVDGAVRYRFQLATDAAFLDIFDDAVSDKPTTEFALSDGATFFIRLTAIAASGMEGLPATYAPGNGPDNAPTIDSGTHAAPADAAGLPSQASLRDHDRTQSASFSPHPSLR